MTIDTLKKFGADTAEGLARCMNNEEFYLKMVNLGLGDERFVTLKGVLEANDLDGAFEIAHALKGVLGNLALTPIFDPVSDLTEKLRAKESADYLALYDEIIKQKQRLESMSA